MEEDGFNRRRHAILFVFIGMYLAYKVCELEAFQLLVLPFVNGWVFVTAGVGVIAGTYFVSTRSDDSE